MTAITRVRPASASGRPSVGDARWNARRHRWQRWSGRRWVVADYSLAPQALQVDVDPTWSPRLSAEQRSRLIRRVREDQVLDGATVVDATAVSVTVARLEPVSHGVHAVLTVLTAGGWGVVWGVMARSRRDRRVRFEVDPWGHVWRVEPH